MSALSQHPDRLAIIEAIRAAEQRGDHDAAKAERSKLADFWVKRVRERDAR